MPIYRGVKMTSESWAVSFFSTHRLVGILAKYIDFSNLGFIICQCLKYLNGLIPEIW